MDWQFLRSGLHAFDLTLFHLGGAAVSLGALVKLLVLGALLLWAAGTLSRFTESRLLRRSHFDAGTRAAVASIVHYTVLVAGAMVVLQTAGINLTAFAIVGSALGVGVGFGLQNIVSNFIS